MGPRRFDRLVGSIPLALAAILAAPFALAQPATAAAPPPIEAPPPSRTMTIAEALAYAHEHQPAIHAGLSRIAQRMAEASLPTGQWLPTVAVTAQLYGMTANNTTGSYLSTQYLDVPRIGGTASQSQSTAGLAPYPASLVGVGVLQEIFDFGRIGAQRAAADELVTVERQRSDVLRLDIDFGVEEAYFSVLAAKAIIVASDQAYERSRVHRDLAKRGVDSGLRSPIELTRAEADLARFDVGRVKARGGLALSQAVLAAAVGAPDPAIDTSPEAPHPADMPTMAEAVRLVEARDPVLAEAVAQLKASEQRTRAVGAELRPDLSLTATLSGRAGGAPPSSPAQPTPSGGGWLPDVPNWDVGLVLSWPLFDGTIAARRDAARAVEQVRRDEIDVAREAEVARVRQAYVKVGVARSALVALENAVLAAHANYEQADARFRAGIGNAVELADAEAVRTDAEIQRALGQFELAQARAAFGRAIAEGL
ncbi:MAG TPA: TolC family protein [Polyangiaceae bacterium]|nr:TolC family protein [Polyangiaceae bacterium]